jgi:hypothetical protein
MSVSVNIRNVGKEFDKAEKELIEAVNTLQRATAFVATSDLVAATPVKTGRARASWQLSKSPKNKVDNLNGVSSAAPLLGPISKNRIEALYLTNGTPYIANLNAGSSTQAPARFIERTLSKYFKITAGSVKFT